MIHCSCLLGVSICDIDASVILALKANARIKAILILHVLTIQKLKPKLQQNMRIVAVC